MASTHSWSELRDTWASTFGGFPSASMEARLIDAFRDHPSRVIAAGDEVLEAYRAGRVKSPWAFLAKMIERLATVEVTVDDRTSDERTEKQAERWVRTVGILIDRDDELVDALFGAHGLLRGHPERERLERKLVTLWLAERPRGERTEREAADYTAKLKTDIERLREARSDVSTLRRESNAQLLSAPRAWVEAHALTVTPEDIDHRLAKAGIGAELRYELVDHAHDLRRAADAATVPPS